MAFGEEAKHYMELDRAHEEHNALMRKVDRIADALERRAEAAADAEILQICTRYYQEQVPVYISTGEHYYESYRGIIEKVGIGTIFFVCEQRGPTTLRVSAIRSVSKQKSRPSDW